MKTLTLEQMGEELRRDILAGKYSALQHLAAKPRAAPTPKKPAMSEAARQAREQLTAKFALYDAFKAMAAQFGEPDNSLACLFVERGMTAEQGRAEYAKRAAIRGWSSALLRAQQIY